MAAGLHLQRPALDVVTQPALSSRDTDLADAGALEAAQAIREGRISSEQLVSACVERIQQREAEIGAWAFFNPELALQQARRIDEAHRRGITLGPLHGVPVGIKDIFDTKDMPTEDGTVLHAGRQPHHDAAVVAMLRAAGAVIMGKTVTAELATYAPGKTRNPQNLEHTPGGSSSGSAAAVAAGMVPLALGSQTNGSVIRPASYCGVVGFKPGFGLISRHGVLRVSRTLDQLGVFARSIEDAALVAQVIMGFDARDPDLRVQAQRDLLNVTRDDPPLEPRLAFVRTPVWEQADRDTQQAFAELVDHLGNIAYEVELSATFEPAVAWHQTIMEAELARSFATEFERGADKLSTQLHEMIERGAKYRAVDYLKARNQRNGLREILDSVFDECDAIITPATTGEAPRGLDSTGSPVFCTLWTYLGLPCVTLPILQGSSGLPMGVQLVGPAGDDARLLRTARWLWCRLLAPGDEAQNGSSTTEGVFNQI